MPEKSSNSSFSQILGAIVQQGNKFLAPLRSGETLAQRCQLLVSTRGEASGTALAREILDWYQRLDDTERLAFFQDLAVDFDPDPTAIASAAGAYALSHSLEDFSALLAASEPPRRELLRRLNLAPSGTEALVRMRADLLKCLAETPDLARVDLDFDLLLKAWFNRGFLDLVRVDWDASASLLDKIIQYEAVHEIAGWEALRERIQPDDRRCFAFFHPRMPNEPLIFVQVALMKSTPAGIGEILGPDREVVEPSEATTAVFYSISNCQNGLRGISFGNFLIKQVAQDLSAEFPQLKTFVTLSPVPGFVRWLQTQQIEGLDTDNQSQLMPLAAQYFIQAKGRGDLPKDPVQRFHLGNGAILDRINWMGDASVRGMKQAHGLMVNYRYDLAKVEENHEAFATDGTVIANRTITQLARKTSA